MLNHKQRELLGSGQEDDWEDWDEEEWDDRHDETFDARGPPRQPWDGKSRYIKDVPQTSTKMNAKISKARATNVALGPPSSGSPSFDDRFGVRVIDMIFQFLVWKKDVAVHTSLTSVGRMAATCRRFCRLLWLAGRETGSQLWPSTISEDAIVAQNAVADDLGDAYYALLARELAWCNLEPLEHAMKRFPLVGKLGAFSDIASLALIPSFDAAAQNPELVKDDDGDDDDEHDNDQKSLRRALSFDRKCPNSRSIMASWDEPITPHELQLLRGIDFDSSRPVPSILLHDAELAHLIPERDFCQSGLPKLVAADAGEILASTHFSIGYHLSVKYVFSWSKLPLREAESVGAKQYFPTKLNIEAVWFTDDTTIVIAGPLITETTWALQCWSLPPTSTPMAERSLPAPVHCGIVLKTGRKALLMLGLGNQQVVAYRSCTLKAVKVWDCAAAAGSLCVAPDPLGLVAWCDTHLLHLKTNGETSELAACMKHPGSMHKVAHDALFHLSCHKGEALVLCTSTIIQVFASDVFDLEGRSDVSWGLCWQMQVKAILQVLHVDSRKIIVLQDDHRLVVHFWPVGFKVTRDEELHATYHRTPLATIDLGQRLFADCRAICAEISCAVCGVDASLGLLWIAAVSRASPSLDEYGRARIGFWMRRGDGIRREQEEPQNATRSRIQATRQEDETVEPQRPLSDREIKAKKNLEIQSRQAAKKAVQTERNDASKRRAQERTADRDGY